MKTDPDRSHTIEDGMLLDGLVGYNLKRAYVVMHEDFRRTLGEDGLNPRAFAVLAFAVQRQGITQSEVARTLGIERSGLVAIVDELERKDLVSRTPVPGDRRVQALHATNEGQRVFAAASKAVAAHEERLLSFLSEAEKRHLLKILQTIRNAGETGHD